jgi:hypothetical protein
MWDAGSARGWVRNLAKVFVATALAAAGCGGSGAPTDGAGYDRGGDAPDGGAANDAADGPMSCPPDALADGGSDADASSDAGACIVQQTLSPGASSAYTPLGVGDRWTYRGVHSIPRVSAAVEFQDRLVVTGSAAVDGGVQAFVISDSNPNGNNVTTAQHLQVQSNGLVNYGDDLNSQSPSNVPGAPAYTEVAFPIQVCSSYPQFQVTSLGRAVTSSATESALEPFTGTAGTFSDSLRLQRTLITSDLGTCGIPTFTFRTDETDWYAPGLGRVRRVVTVEGDQYSFELVGSLVGGVGHGVIPGTTIANLTTSQDYEADRPAVASDGTHFVVVQTTSVSFTAGGLSSMLVGADGTSAAPLSLASASGGAPRDPALAFGGGRYLLAYRLQNAAVFGQLLATDGSAIGGPIAVSTAGATQPAVAYGSGVFLVPYVQGTTITVAVIDGNGVVQGRTQPYLGQTEEFPALASDGTNFAMVWENVTSTGDTHISAGRVNAQGAALDAGITAVSMAPQVEESPDVAFDGGQYVAAWFVRPDRSLEDEGEVRVARIGLDGRLLDGPPSPAGGQAVSGTATPRQHPRIGRLGSQTFVAWELGPTGDTPIYRLVGTRIDSNGVARDTSPTDEGLWVSIQMAGTGGQPVLPEIAYGGGSSLLVYVDRFGEPNRELADTLLFPW